MIEYFKLLPDKTAVPCSFEEGIRQWTAKDRIVAKSYKDGSDVHVSTVFLPLNHAYDDGPPMIFETMIFGGEHDQWQDRCSTWDQAIVQHAKACELAGVQYQAPPTGDKHD